MRVAAESIEGEPGGGEPSLAEPDQPAESAEPTLLERSMESKEMYHAEQKLYM